jgi:hypothetical protein
MTYALMVWTFTACQAHMCVTDWRFVVTFESKTLCEEAGKALFDAKKYNCVRTK